VRIEQATSGDRAELRARRYEPPYDFYDGDQETMDDLGRYFVARKDGGELRGFYYFEEQGETLVYGLGLRPALAGHRLGLDFLRAGIEFGRALYSPSRIVLAVAAFNERAIAIYERAGFRETGRHVRTFERWGDVEFVDMEELR
jgi:[ribosomal protein S18]-alanine N-acetyltransferase